MPVETVSDDFKSVGYVYMAISDDQEIIKIGHTCGNPSQRLMFLRTQLWVKFKKEGIGFLAIWPTDHPVEDERKLLDEFRSKVVMGAEWHQACPELSLAAQRPGRLVNPHIWGIGPRVRKYKKRKR